MYQRRLLLLVRIELNAGRHFAELIQQRPRLVAGQDAPRGPWYVGQRRGQRLAAVVLVRD